MGEMKRRQFLALMAAAGAWPVPADAQQSTLPAVGFLSSFPADTRHKFAEAFKQGLSEAGFADGQNVTIEYSWAEAGQYDRLPAMAADLIDKRNVGVLFATPINAAVAAKKASPTTPVVFAIGARRQCHGSDFSLCRIGPEASRIIARSTSQTRFGCVVGEPEESNYPEANK